MARTLDDIKGDIFDSRDVIERIEELEARDEDEDRIFPLDEDERQELDTLRAFAEQAERVADWQYGVAFIPESHFEDYARDLAERIGGAIDRDARWPLSYIDWPAAADALKQDYTDFELEGETYYARS